MKRKLCFLALPCLFFRPLLGMLGTLVAIVMLCLSSSTAGYTQQPLSIGDKVPAGLTVGNVIRHPSGQVKIGDFRGKLLILDFWATWCSPCVAMMPKADSLQKAFGRDLQILPVTTQTRAEVERLLGKAAKLKSVRLPFAVSDTTLGKLFPHRELPHYVWIDRSGAVVAITDHRSVNAANIKKMLSQAAVSLPEKRDTFNPYTSELPLLFQASGVETDEVVFQSLLTDYIEGIRSGLHIVRDDNDRIQRISMTNAWIQFLFGLAYSNDTVYFDRRRIVQNVKQPERLISHAEGEEFKAWLRTNSWCYELILPKHLSDRAFEIMRSDMVRLFPQYKVTIEKRRIPCIVLVRTSTLDKIASKGPSVEPESDGYGLSLSGEQIGGLAKALNHYLQPLRKPVIDRTGYSGKIDITLDTSLSSLPDLRVALAAYDLDLVERTEAIEVLVISDAQ